jgi:hypothetical protein
MNPTIVISKHDGHYLITCDPYVRIFDKYEDAAKFIEETLNKPEMAPASQAPKWVEKLLWGSDEIKEG